MSEYLDRDLVALWGYDRSSEPSRSAKGSQRGVSTVLFHRNFQHFQGGHLKVFDYFQHVRSSPSHDAVIEFSADSVWDDSNPWSRMRDAVVSAGDTVRPDMRFLAGMDWGRLSPEERVSSPLPIVNLIQGVRHARRGSALHEFLAYPAIRICVSDEVREALEGASPVNGPIFTIPVGIDLEQLPPALPAQERNDECLVLAVKDPPLGSSIAERIRAAGYPVRLVERPVARDELLGAMARAKVAVLLPLQVEGAYIPALECMALGSVVVCPDCVGNRAFCRDGVTALVPARTARALAESALQALSASAQELDPMLAAARAQSSGTRARPRARALPGDPRSCRGALERSLSAAQASRSTSIAMPMPPAAHIDSMP